MDSSAPINILSLCTGTGGLELAVGLAVRNARTVCYVEKDAQAIATLAARMDDGTLCAAPVWSDVRTFDGRAWRGVVDWIVASIPCQPNSVAGLGRGAEDERDLGDELVRIVAEVRPHRVFYENVPGNTDGQLRVVVSGLEGLGYRCAVGIFSAAEVGAAHRRERLFMLCERVGDSAVPGPPVRRRPSLGDAECGGLSGNDRGRARQKPADRCEQLADAHRPERQGQQTGERDARGRQEPDGHPVLCSRAGLPIFAPGPNSPWWHDIAASDPLGLPAHSRHDRFRIALGDALPAADGLPRTGPQGDCGAAGPANPAVIQAAAQSHLRGAPDGLATRANRLRLAGDGVCSMAGAVALVALSAHFDRA